MDMEEVRGEVMRAASRARRRVGEPSPEPEPPVESKAKLALPMPHPRDRLLTTERQTTKLLIQHPELFADGWEGLSVGDFTHPAYAAVFSAVEKAAAEGVPGPGDSAAHADWVRRVTDSGVEEIRSLVAGLAVEPLPVQGEVEPRFVVANTAGLQLLTVMRAIAELKSRLQRTSPLEAQRSYNQMFSELVVLEARRKELHTRSIGAAD
jgi:DNA primase